MASYLFVHHGVVPQFILLGLNVSPAHTVAHPVDARQRGKLAELILFDQVSLGKPSGCRVDANRRVLRRWFRQGGEYGGCGPCHFLVR